LLVFTYFMYVIPANTFQYHLVGAFFPKNGSETVTVQI